MMVKGDAHRLAQILSNLLENASKYTPPGGQIWLTAEPRTSHLRLTVRDNGIGIPQAQFGAIFEMFSQLKDPRASEVGGLGVGLALVRSLAELHGGRIEVTSEGSEREVASTHPALLEATVYRSATELFLAP